MKKPRIYTQQSLKEGLYISLEAAASNHLHKVLRLAENHLITVFNGTGGEYQARIVKPHKQRTEIEIQAFSADNKTSPLSLELGIALSKGDRMDWVMQKATELGVTKITPLISERTEVKLSGERLEKRLTRWQQQIISACEQCGRNVLPQLSSSAKLPAWCQDNTADVKAVLHHRTANTLTSEQSPKAVSLLVGPEGGLSDDEIKLATTCGFVPMSLGPRVLRTETAPLAAISLLQYIWGDMG